MRSLVFVLLIGCGRGEPAPPTGADGGACYPNGTCDEGLLCSTARLCAPPVLPPCAGVTCSGHGTCQLDASGAATCNCEAGYRAEGTSCVCSGSGCTGGCPADMVLNVSQNVCIDRYEATLFLNPDCTAPRYGGDVIDDYPAGFPDAVESDGCAGTCGGQTTEPQTTPLYACSVAGVVPSGYLTWFQAKRACENVGKRLCSRVEWYTACAGPNLTTYPYGEEFDYVCNDANTGGPTLSPTGSWTACEGGYPGIFDMSGNAEEWTTECDGGPTCVLNGGAVIYYAPNDLRCAYRANAQTTLETHEVGARCCLTP